MRREEDVCSALKHLHRDDLLLIQRETWSRPCRNPRDTTATKSFKWMSPTSNEMNWPHSLRSRVPSHNLTPEVSLPQMHNLNLNMRKHDTNPKPRLYNSKMSVSQKTRKVGEDVSGQRRPRSWAELNRSAAWDWTLGQEQLLQCTLLGHVVKFQYGLWIAVPRCQGKFSDFDNCIVVLEEAVHRSTAT